MPLFTLQDRAGLAAYLRQEAKAHGLAAHFAAEYGSAGRAIDEKALAEQLEHWAGGIEGELKERQLSAVDAVPPPSVEIPVEHARAHTPGDDAINS